MENKRKKRRGNLSVSRKREDRLRLEQKSTSVGGGSIAPSVVVGAASNEIQGAASNEIQDDTSKEIQGAASNEIQGDTSKEIQADIGEAKVTPAQGVSPAIVKHLTPNRDKVPFRKSKGLPDNYIGKYYANLRDIPNKKLPRNFPEDIVASRYKVGSTLPTKSGGKTTKNLEDLITAQRESDGEDDSSEEEETEEAYIDRILMQRRYTR